MAIADNLIANESIEFQSQKPGWRRSAHPASRCWRRSASRRTAISPSGDGSWGRSGIMDIVAWVLLIEGAVGSSQHRGLADRRFAVTNQRDP